MAMVHRRTDGRLEVADTGPANDRYGCQVDDWCILANGHDGDCNEDREAWPGPDIEYPNESEAADVVDA
jgi:hypothetical protein